MQSNLPNTYKYPNPSPLSPKDTLNGPINETFVLNCPKCASHFKSSPLLEQHLKAEHNITDYAVVNFNPIHSGEEKSDNDKIMDLREDENEEDDSMMILDEDQEDVNDENDMDGIQETGQDTPYSGGQNVVSKPSFFKYFCFSFEWIVRVNICKYVILTLY